MHSSAACCLWWVGGGRDTPSTGTSAHPGLTHHHVQQYTHVSIHGYSVPVPVVVVVVVVAKGAHVFAGTPRQRHPNGSCRSLGPAACISRAMPPCLPA